MAASQAVYTQGGQTQTVYAQGGQTQSVYAQGGAQTAYTTQAVQNTAQTVYVQGGSGSRVQGGYTTEQVTYSGVPAGYTVANQGYTTGTTYTTGPVKTVNYEYTTGPTQTYEYTTNGPVQTYEYTTGLVEAGKDRVSRQNFV